jgi:predicted alpha/beta-hydrolase family hydrolase
MTVAYDRLTCDPLLSTGSLPMRKPLLLFAPGAGAPSTSDWIVRWAGLLQSVGEVRRFDYDYMVEGRKRPDRLPQLIASHRAALQQARDGHEGAVFLIGKSMGGRVGCHVSLEQEVSGVICLGYPLCAADDVTKLRDEVLRSMHTPVLFVQGTRDSMCPLEILDKVRREMKAEHRLHVVDGDDHSLRVTKTQLKSAGQTQEDFDQLILRAIQKLVEACETSEGKTHSL